MMSNKFTALALILASSVLLSGALFFGIRQSETQTSSFQVPQYAREAFTAYKTKFNKMYASPEEELHRLANFYQTLVRIKAKNSANLSYTSGLNDFSDLSKAEFKAKYLGLKPVNLQQEVDYSLLTKESPSNTEVDWRNSSGVVSNVKNQWFCGSCWAFSATGALEGLAAIQGGKPAQSFSEQQLVDCSKDYDNDGCQGGLMTNAFKYVKDNGITTEQKYPYVGFNQKCKTSLGDFKITGFKNVPPKSSPALANACDTQPISIAIEADEIQDYTEGIFDDPDCGDQLDHGVLLVGYTDTYWIVKNSWGILWGEDGYIRFSRKAIPDKDGGICGILMMASYPLLN